MQFNHRRRTLVAMIAIGFFINTIASAGTVNYHPPGLQLTGIHSQCSEGNVAGCVVVVVVVVACAVVGSGRPNSLRRLAASSWRSVRSSSFARFAANRFV